MLKASRKAGTFLGVKLDGKRFNTPRALAGHIATIVAVSVMNRYNMRHPDKPMSWTKRYTMEQRVIRRVLPRCKWFMERN